MTDDVDSCEDDIVTDGDCPITFMIVFVPSLLITINVLDGVGVTGGVCSSVVFRTVAFTPGKTDCTLTIFGPRNAIMKRYKSIKFRCR